MVSQSESIPLMEAVHELRVIRDTDLRSAISEVNDLLATGQLEAVGVVDGVPTKINALWWWASSNFEYPNSSVAFNLLADGEPRPTRATEIRFDLGAWERQKARIAAVKQQEGGPFAHRDDPAWDNPVKLIDAIRLWSPTFAQCLHQVKWASPNSIRDVARRLEMYNHPTRIHARRDRAKRQRDGELYPESVRELLASRGNATDQDFPEPLREAWARLLQEWERWDDAERLVNAFELAGQMIIAKTKRGQPYVLKYSPSETQRGLSADYECVGDARHDGLGSYDFDIRNSLMRDPAGNWLPARISGGIDAEGDRMRSARLAREEQDRATAAAWATELERPFLQRRIFSCFEVAEHLTRKSVAELDLGKRDRVLSDLNDWIRRGEFDLSGESDVILRIDERPYFRLFRPSDIAIVQDGAAELAAHNARCVYLRRSACLRYIETNLKLGNARRVLMLWFPEPAPSAPRPATAEKPHPMERERITNAMLFDAVTDALRRLGTPGTAVQWKPFCDHVRRECKATPQTRGYGDRSTQRLVKRVQAGHDKPDKCDIVLTVLMQCRRKCGCPGCIPAMQRTAWRAPMSNGLTNTLLSKASKNGISSRPEPPSAGDQAGMDRAGYDWEGAEFFIASGTWKNGCVSAPISIAPMNWRANWRPQRSDGCRRTKSGIPLDALALYPRWVAWRNELRGKKPTKVPYAPDGKKAKADDPSTWGTRAEAEARAKRLVNGHGGGIGIQLGALGANMHLCGIDLDSCISDHGALAPWAVEIVSAVQTYTERSPSGRGLKMFFYTATKDVRPFLDRIGVSPDAWGTRRSVPCQDGRDHGPAIEVYFAHRYFAVTEDRWPGAPDRLATLDTATLDRLAELIPAAKSVGATGQNSADNSRSAIAFRMGLAMCRAGQSFDEFSEGVRNDPRTADWHSEKGMANGERELHRIWQKAERVDGHAEPPLVIDPRAPYDIARSFLNALFIVDGRRTLHRHRGGFYAWNGTAFPGADEEGLKAKLYAFLDQCTAFDANGDKRSVKPNMRMVGNVLDALAAASQLDSTISAPAWLDPVSDFPSEEILCCANGLLHLPTLTLLPHSPAFFTHNPVTFAFERDAPEPKQWLQFLRELWPNDQAAIDTLQEIFGYCLTADTSQQKMFLIVGPKRSGKGTLARVLTGVIGLDNSIAPTLAGLGTNFGLAPLIGKRVAIISDARLGGRADQHVIAERLLSISGEDAITVDRKYRETWTGRLQTRFVILSNELPRLADASGALAGRFIVLVLIRSFYGRAYDSTFDRAIRDPQLGYRRMATANRTRLFLDPGILDRCRPRAGGSRFADRGFCARALRCRSRPHRRGHAAV